MENKTNKLVFILVFSFAHAAASLFFIFFELAITLSRFDSGEPSSIFESIVNIISIMLAHPLFYYASLWLAKFNLGPFGLIIIWLNSFLWAFVLWYGWRWLKHVKNKKHASVQNT